jgi:Protein of unknown function (DUF1189)
VNDAIWPFRGTRAFLFLPAFYRDVARNWGGIGILYVLLLFTLAWMPELVKMQLGVRKFAQEDFPKFAENMPDITIKNGKISSPVEQPLEIKDERGNVVFVLDTTGKIKTLDQTPAKILVTETKIHQRDEFGNIQIHDLGQFPDFEFTRAWLQGWMDFIGTWLWVAVFPIVMMGSLIRALILMLFVSLSGPIFNTVFDARVSYGGLLRFGAVGMTLSVYLDTGLGMANMHVPFWFLFALLLTTAYAAFGTFVSVPPKVDVFADWDREDDSPRPADRDTGIKSAPDY